MVSPQTIRTTPGRETSRGRPTFSREQLKMTLTDSGSAVDARELQCKCGQSRDMPYCMSMFSPGNILDKRITRFGMTPAEDSIRRKECLQEAVNHGRARFAVGEGDSKLVCMKAYCELYGYCYTYVQRLFQKMKNGVVHGNVGRPTVARDSSGDTILLTAVTMRMKTWIEGWIQLTAEHQPVNIKYNYVMGFHFSSELYRMYTNRYLSESALTFPKPPSQSTFKKMFNKVMKDMKVYVRHKKNITEKCQGKHSWDCMHTWKLTKTSHSTHVGRAECKVIIQSLNVTNLTREKRQSLEIARVAHSKKIQALRQCYEQDIITARSDDGFATITTDGTNSEVSGCPQGWRAEVHGENTNTKQQVQQKIQSVLIHGRCLQFYVFTPVTQSGMNMTCSVLLKAMLQLDGRVKKVRLQVDGENITNTMHYHCTVLFTDIFCLQHTQRTGGSENENYALKILCAFLVKSGRFNEIKVCRLPVGWVNKCLLYSIIVHPMNVWHASFRSMTQHCGQFYTIRNALKNIITRFRGV